MSADATDMRFFYAENLGPTQVLTGVGAGAAVASGKLSPGRYRVRFFAVAGGATLVWCRQGPFGEVVAAAAAPSAPFEVAAAPRPEIVTMARGSMSDGLSFRTDAGTVSVAIIKISREE